MKNFVDLDITNKRYGNKAGGKFFGLLQAKDILNEVAKKYDLHFKIPKTYAIPHRIQYQFENPKTWNNFDRMYETSCELMRFCGGNVAVRSSANIEDAGGSTFSGAFSSVLNVNNEAMMRSALYDVYMSRYNKQVEQNPFIGISDVKMGVIIQEMIDSPDFAGVIYSEGYQRQPFNVIRYVKNKNADELLNNKERGVTKRVMKIATSKYNNKDIACIMPRIINNRDNFNFHEYNRGVKKLSPEHIEKNIKMFKLIALVNYFELKLGHPIDMEFAIKNDDIYILQQRPYIKPTFETKWLNNYCMTIYNPKHPVIQGRVTILDDEYDHSQNDIVILKKDKTAIIQIGNYKDIETQIAIEENLYNHLGNNIRENSNLSTMFFYDTNMPDSSIVNRIKTGDIVRIDLCLGKIDLWKTSHSR